MKWKTLYLWMMLACSLCAGQAKQASPPTSRSYLALGDSYTIGESVTESLRWPNQLVASLNKKGGHFRPAKIIAKTGWTTDELSKGMDDLNLAEHYDYVSLLIGVNNQYRGRSVANFALEFKELLQSALSLSGGNNANVFVLSIPDWGVMPFAKDRNREQIAKEIDAYNTVIAQICQQYKIAYFNITPISRKAKTAPQLIAKDGLHPSGEMYTQWVKEVLPFFNSVTHD